MKAKKGNYVKVQYKGTLKDGKVFDSNEGRELLGFTVGAGQMIKGFDQAIEGMEEGETKTFTLKPEEAYGQRREELKYTFPREQTPEGIKEGMQVILSAPTGERVPATIKKITDNEVEVDLNHPLAGEELTFEVTLKEVHEKAPEEERCCGGNCGCSNDSCGC